MQAKVEKYNGRVVVRDMPLLAETRETDPRVVQKRGGVRGKAWLERALKLYRERGGIGYTPPLQFRHSDAKPKLAGTYVPTRVELMAVNPGEKPRWTLLGDYVFKSQVEYEEWRDGYPYQSPEISPDFPEEIDALALLSEAPYNKFPVPTVVEMFRSAGVEVPVAGKGDSMESDKAPEAAGPEAAGGKDLAGLHEKIDKLATMQEKFTTMHGETMGAMKELCSTLKAKFASEKEDAEDESDNEAEDKGPQSSPAVFKALRAEQRSELEKFRAEQAVAAATQKGELDGLRKQLEASRQEVARREGVEKMSTAAEQQLVAMGFALGDEDRQTIRSQAALGKEALDGYLLGQKKALDRAGVRSGLEAYGSAREEPSHSDDGGEPEFYKTCVKAGGKQASAARELYRAWLQMGPKARSAFANDFEKFATDYDEQGRKVPLGKVDRLNGKGY